MLSQLMVFFGEKMYPILSPVKWLKMTRVAEMYTLERVCGLHKSKKKADFYSILAAGLVRLFSCISIWMCVNVPSRLDQVRLSASSYAF